MAETSDKMTLEEATEIVVKLLPMVVEEAIKAKARYNREAVAVRQDYGDFMYELVQYRTMGFFKRLAFAFGLYRPAP